MAAVTEKITIPEGITATVDGTRVTMKGEKGELTRTLGTKQVTVRVEGSDLVFTAENEKRNYKRVMRTNMAHARNVLRGVKEGHTYKLKICTGHFPMTVTAKNGVLEVKNFIGESVPRRLTLFDNVDVKVDGQDITVVSVDKERAGNQASEIERLTKRSGFDMRIFQDGIYITEKDGRAV